MSDKTILIADDDSELCQALALRCRRLGFTAVTSTSGNRALHLAESLLPDLICLDVDMPGGNGLAVCEMLAGNESLSTTPVIILSGRRDATTIERCRTMGALYLGKSGNTWKELEPLILRTINLSKSDAHELPQIATVPEPNVSHPVEEIRVAIFEALGADETYLMLSTNRLIDSVL